MAFKNKVIIITGASSGIGRELSFGLAKAGAKLVIAARDEARLVAISKKCNELGADVLVVKTDVSDENQCKHLIEQTAKHFGSIDMLINNAGFGIRGTFEEFPDLDLFKKVMDVNYYGSVYCTRFALPYLKQSKGRVVAVSSVLGKISMPKNTAYCGSKFAMAGFFDALRQELFGSGVSVTVIYPGYVVTEFAERMVNIDGTPQGPEARKFYLKGMMTPNTCAKIIIDAAKKRKREIVMTSYGVLGVWFKMFFPNLLDRILVLISKEHKKRVVG